MSHEKTSAVTATIWRYAYTGGFAYFSTPVNVGHMGVMIFFEKMQPFLAKRTSLLTFFVEQMQEQKNDKSCMTAFVCLCYF